MAQTMDYLKITPVAERVKRDALDSPVDAVVFAAGSIAADLADVFDALTGTRCAVRRRERTLHTWVTHT